MSNGKGLQNMQTPFASCINDVQYNCLVYDHWEIAHRPYVDDYNIPLPKRGDGSQYIPDEQRNEFIAMNLVEHLGISFFDVMNLRYDEFVRLSLIVKAKMWQEPTKTPADKAREEHQRRLRR